MSTLTMQQITHQSLQVLEKEFDYTMRFVNGKYSVYRWEYNGGIRTSTTLARGLDKTTATGMMKLLEDKND